jgi:Zn-dependent protease
MNDPAGPSGSDSHASRSVESRDESTGSFDATVGQVGPETAVQAEIVAEQGEAESADNATQDVYERAAAHARGPRRRRIALPVMLFLATCLSTFFAAAAGWEPSRSMIGVDYRGIILQNWGEGLIYMVCVVAILLAHEMGHFLATVRYGVPASLPFFIPLPVVTPLGTLGAVIGMDGRKADRRELFDIGIAGPLAGLVLAVPIFVVGVATMDLGAPAGGLFGMDIPIFGRWLFELLHPDQYHRNLIITSAQLNPYYMAGWVGMLVTGLNMMPISQLDGGHVLYALFGKRAHVMARLLVLLLIVYIVFWEAGIWAPMLVLVILLGIDHPRTADDTARLGWFRRWLGCVALLIPVLCLPPKGLWVL